MEFRLAWNLLCDTDWSQIPGFLSQAPDSRGIKGMSPHSQLSDSYCQFNEIYFSRNLHIQRQLQSRTDRCQFDMDIMFLEIKIQCVSKTPKLCHPRLLSCSSVEHSLKLKIFFKKLTVHLVSYIVQITGQGFVGNQGVVSEPWGQLLRAYKRVR